MSVYHVIQPRKLNTNPQSSKCSQPSDSQQPGPVLGMTLNIKGLFIREFHENRPRGTATPDPGRRVDAGTVAPLHGRAEIAMHRKPSQEQEGAEITRQA